MENPQIDAVDPTTAPSQSPTYKVVSPKTGQTYVFSSPEPLTEDDLHSSMDSADADYIQQRSSQLRGGTGQPMSAEEAKAIERQRLPERELLSGMPNPSKTITDSNGNQVTVAPNTPSLGMEVLGTANRFGNQASLGGLGVLEKGMKNYMVDNGLQLSPDVSNALEPKNINESAPPVAGLAADFAGGLIGPPVLKGLSIVKNGSGLLSKLGQSAIEGAKIGAVSEANRQIANGEGFDPTSLTKGALYGGGLGLGFTSVAKSPEILSNIKIAVPNAIRSTKTLFSNIGDNWAQKGIEKTAGNNLAEEAALKAEDANKVAASQTAQAPQTTVQSTPQGFNAKISAAPPVIDENLPNTVKELVKTSLNKNLDRFDVNVLTNLSPEENGVVKTMIDKAEKFKENPTNDSLEPRLVVGNDLFGKIQSAEQIRKSIGKKLGDYANTIPKEAIDSSGTAPQEQFVSEDSLGSQTQPTSTKNVQQAVLNNMQNVPRLQGISMDEGGKLNFENTGFTSAQQAADRKAIQEEFDLMKEKTPYQLHKFRQALFDQIDAEHSDTHDLAMNSIRKGIADVLDQANPEYKALNQKYAQVAGPLADLKAKFFKGTDLSNQDFVTAKSAQLARRLTSNAESGILFKDEIGNLESSLKDNGIPINTNLRNLQMAYNTVERYHPELVRRNSLQGETNSAITHALSNKGLFETSLAIGKHVINPTSTMAVKQKALKNLVEGLSKIPSSKTP